MIRWIEVSISPVFSIRYANLNKSYNFCTLLDDLVELPSQYDAASENNTTVQNNSYNFCTLLDDLVECSMMLLARNMLSAFFYSPLVGLTSYLCELDINSSLFGNQDA